MRATFLESFVAKVELGLEISIVSNDFVFQKLENVIVRRLLEGKLKKTTLQ